MTPLQIGALVAVLLGTAAWCGTVALRRTPRSLAEAQRRMRGEDPSNGTRFGSEWPTSLSSTRFGRSIVERFGDDLGIVDLTPADVVSRVVVSAAILTGALGAATAALTSMGLLPASFAWWVACLAFGALAGWIALRDVASKIERRRLEVRQAANDFIQLVAVGLTTDQSVEEAVRFALAVGSSPAFDELRRVVLAAPQRGVAVWDAINEFGERFDVRELREFAASVERQGLQGVSIGDSVATLAASMRSTALDRLEREADKANANLSGPTIGFVVTTIVFLAYPLAQRISDAFGG
jgi:Flp pilus assembly protein TadB